MTALLKAAVETRITFFDTEPRFTSVHQREELVAKLSRRSRQAKWLIATKFRVSTSY